MAACAKALSHSKRRGWQCRTSGKSTRGHCSLQATQEVGFLDSLPSRVSSALGNLLALVEASSGVRESVLRGCFTVVGCGRDIVRVVVGGNLGSKGSGASSKFLLVTLSLLFVQSCGRVDMLDESTFSPIGAKYILLGSTPPLSVFDCLLASPRRSQSQSGYSESSLATMSGLFLK